MKSVTPGSPGRVATTFTSGPPADKSMTRVALIPRADPSTVHCVSGARTEETSNPTVAVEAVSDMIWRRGCCTVAVPWTVDCVVIRAVGVGPSDEVPGTSPCGRLRPAWMVKVADRTGELVSLALITIVRVGVVERSISISRTFCAEPPSTAMVTVTGARPPSTSTTMRDCVGSCTVPEVLEVLTRP